MGPKKGKKSTVKSSSTSVSSNSSATCSEATPTSGTLSSSLSARTVSQATPTSATLSSASSGHTAQSPPTPTSEKPNRLRQFGNAVADFFIALFECVTRTLRGGGGTVAAPVTLNVQISGSGNNTGNQPQAGGSTASGGGSAGVVEKS